MALHVRNRWATTAAGLLALVGTVGCAQRGADSLVIATTWPVEKSQQVEASFAQWASPAGRPIAWVRVTRDDELVRLVERDPRIDLVLGASSRVLEQLAAADLLGPAPIAGNPLWCVVRRAPIGLAFRPGAISANTALPGGAKVSVGTIAPRAALALDDPRVDPLTFALMKAQLAGGGWAQGYEALVHAAGHARPIGRGSGAALARLERKDAACAPAVLASRPGTLPMLALQGNAEAIEGVALARRAGHADGARSFLQFLRERGEAEPAQPPDPLDTQVDGLLADLLGATLVDAQDELRAACNTLARRAPGERAELEQWLSQAPPWPPASVAALQQAGEPGPWLDTLAEQLTTRRAARDWLLQSWRDDEAPIDFEHLRSLAAADGGRLAAEPRFRAWLRAEWTAWARQRYKLLAHPIEAPSS